MGCVYSYPLFSFQGSICFSAAKIILSNLHFLVKHFFIFIFVLFTDISHQQKLVYQVRVHLSMFLFKNFSIFCDFCDSIFSVCSAVFAGTFIYYTRLPKNVNTFFHFFSFSFQTPDFSAISPIRPPHFPPFLLYNAAKSPKAKPQWHAIRVPFLSILFLRLSFLLLRLSFLLHLRNAKRTCRIPCNVYRCSSHVKNTVYPCHKRNPLYGQANALQHHCQHNHPCPRHA